MRRRLPNVLLGIWLSVSPFVLGVTDVRAQQSDTWMGASIAVIALLALVVPVVRWVNTLQGAWLLAAPFVWGVDERVAVVNDLVVGVLVLAFSLVPSTARQTLNTAHAGGPMTGGSAA